MLIFGLSVSSRHGLNLLTATSSDGTIMIKGTPKIQIEDGEVRRSWDPEFPSRPTAVAKMSELSHLEVSKVFHPKEQSSTVVRC